jgi:beta-lactam-binding protein with PASTA domain
MNGDMKVAPFFLMMLPFVAFISGYYFTSSLFSVSSIQIPVLVGLSSSRALALLSDSKLIPHVVDIKEDDNLDEGTIISQSPKAGQSAKQYQSIFLVISKKPVALKAPAFVGKQIDGITAIAHDLGIKLSVYQVPSCYPTHTCIAQDPRENESLSSHAMTIYTSLGSLSLVIWPDCVGKTVMQARDFFALHEISPELFHVPQSYAHELSDD